MYLRELLDYGVLEALVWLDTRDMTSDGLTKGAVDRKALHDLMEGSIVISHECKHFQPKARKDQRPELRVEKENQD